MKYRKLKSGEIVEAQDEFEWKGRYWPVESYTVGQRLLPCNVGYYRRIKEQI